MGFSEQVLLRHGVEGLKKHGIDNLEYTLHSEDIIVLFKAKDESVEKGAENATEKDGYC